MLTTVLFSPYLFTLTLGFLPKNTLRQIDLKHSSSQLFPKRNNCFFMHKNATNIKIFVLLYVWSITFFLLSLWIQSIICLRISIKYANNSDQLCSVFNHMLSISSKNRFEEHRWKHCANKYLYLELTNATYYFYYYFESCCTRKTILLDLYLVKTFHSNGNPIPNWIPKYEIKNQDGSFMRWRGCLSYKLLSNLRWAC